MPIKHYDTRSRSFNPRSQKPRRRRRVTGRFVLFIVIVVAVIALVFLAINAFGGQPGAAPSGSAASSGGKPASPASSGSEEPSAASGAPSASAAALPDLKIAPIAATDPAKQKFTTKIYKDTEEISSYTRSPAISFPQAQDYTAMEGIITFRGNNYRNISSYGTAEVTEEKLTRVWTAKTGSVTKSGGSGSWTGSGWTGQPLVVKWPEDTKKLMNLKDEYKSDPDFVEVIYACLDGYIHFYDLKSGGQSRPAIKTGVAHKGTASLYPTGIPLLFIGQGDKTPSGDGRQMKYRVISLIDGKVLYTFGSNDPDRLRTDWEAYDSSPLISADTDTLIEPGENGVLYTIKLNTKFDKTTGELSVKPDDPVKFTYTSPKYGIKKPPNHWYGWETSAAIWRNYFFAGDNGGTMTCIDLNTMKLVWAADIKDDTNSSPVLEESVEDKTAYIYTANSIEASMNKDSQTIIQKLDIKNGKAVWQTPYKCNTNSNTEGGVEGTPILGKNDISNLVIYPLGRYPGKANGTLVALDKETGKEVWKVQTGNYLWSSPVTFYTPEGKSYVVVCDVTGGDKTAGNIYLIEGKSGKLLHKYTIADYNSAEYDPENKKLGSAIEATPAVYNDMLVIGTRGQRVYGFKIK